MMKLLNYSKLNINQTYQIVYNGNYDLMLYGLVKDAIVTLDKIFMNWIYIFLINNEKIGIRVSDLKTLTFRKFNYE